MGVTAVYTMREEIHVVTKKSYTLWGFWVRGRSLKKGLEIIFSESNKDSLEDRKWSHVTFTGLIWRKQGYVITVKSPISFPQLSTQRYP
jgi:hypothetical protein